MVRKQLTSCCSKFYRNILIAFNIIILIIGLVITILAALLKYDKKFMELINLDALSGAVDIAKINSITILFLVIGVFAIVLSLVGLLGLFCLSKVLMYVYWVIVLLLFLSHGIGLLVLVFGKGSIETEFKKAMGDIVNVLNDEKNTTGKYEVDCNTMQLLSNLFHCCGNISPGDFNNNTAALNGCCKKEYVNSDGCTQKTIDSITQNAINFLIIPSCVILGTELLVLIVTPLIIKDIRRLDYNI